MGGKIKVQSQIGKGTTFIIEIIQLCKIKSNPIKKDDLLAYK
jgi:hypothetical protein